MESAVKLVKLVINDESVLEYDRGIELPENQLKYLDDMDKRMTNGFVLADQFIAQPDKTQKAQFVALNLLTQIDNKDSNDAVAMFTYIVNRLENLKQLKAKGEKGQYQFEFVFDNDFSSWDKISFH